MGVKKINIDGSALPIATFKLKDMVKDPSIVMVAKRGSGKSWVCRDLLKHFDKIGIPGGMIIAKTDKMNPFYGKFFPDLYIHYEYSTAILDKLLARQSYILAKRDKKKRKHKKINPRAFLIMDDCLASKTSWVKDRPITEIFYNGRHYKLTFILTMQFPLGIGPELRCNFDYIFLLADDFISNQKRLYDHYAGMFPNFDAFKSVYSGLTANYGCMVIVNRGDRKDPMDKVFYYKAGTGKMDTFGSKQFIKLNDKNYNKKWDDYDPAPKGLDDFVKKKKINPIKIEIKK